MQYKRLGHSDLNVSTICLGTMTWGEQNTEAEAHAQLDYAWDHGVNFLDAAEMYPVPPKPETQGRTEAYIGTWLKARQNRDKVIIATKVAGPGTAHIRGGSRLNEAQIRLAVEASLQRLNTDVIDLYQVHWPERGVNNFGRLGYVHRDDSGAIPIEETLDALGKLVAEGKVRHIGVSNETPWGVERYLQAARDGAPRIVSIQNPYSLVNRSFEIGLAEYAHREGVELLAYSPLAMGALSGKYMNGARPEGARMSIFTRFTRYLTPHGEVAIDKYVGIARKHGLDPSQMALAYINSRPFLGSNIIGATTVEQLAINIGSVDVTLSDAVIEEIEAVHRMHSNPCP
ncbi:NADP(H)-dependent aldo-keto reductase [Zavarzinia sp. CC-PAN008]|uniref:NADP(H)-dependent aldo-keto reductase n=1 Tax=Zavarzinia sp. CC-PAN008 TaxID=3243332 RepID=UPI003F745A1F